MSAAEKTAHTKTPWLLSGADGTALGVRFLISAGHRIIAETRSNAFVSMEEAEANAELIVRAVNSHADLLSALNGLLDEISKLSDDARAEFGGPTDAVVKKAAAAIAKAEGHA